jgi:hypothetical protein
VEIARQAREQTGDVGYGPWTREALLLAEVIDGQQRMIFTIVRVLGGKGSEPQPYPRPGVLTAQQRARLIEPEAVERVLELQQLREEHAQRRADAGLE